ncbi:YaiI/YqxD family protein [Shewanella sp. OMA3-2]|uniref:YaiI/YqxD family protein n=1 Tax=Shewanella sp. OMA3-2 TaxID=2908650 RepID=UPI001F49009F|nr:YaiI/YqxD family protein [Shewanella sp. OMA3-2]UJF21028.1 YaiI/YqxD family protein [Shewanella sp. OMA3-2]
MQAKIWVDADACPNPVKEMLFRAAERKSVNIVLVANQMIKIPISPFIKMIRVSSGFDEADNYIVEQLNQGDLVITADIPLASDAIEKGALAINPRGNVYTPENIKQTVTMRDFMEEMRSSGVHTQGPNTFSQTDKHAFAQSLDKWLVKQR